ncbi:hypothetical protein JXA84_05590 [candidate division WOR-3 bacterium]|nr:hypothetical protein [candidate division WOR-3 bacterium]
MEIIKIFDPSLSLKRKPELKGLVKTALELSGIVFRFVQKLPCDVVFTEGANKVMREKAMAIDSSALNSVFEGFQGRSMDSGYFLENFADNISKIISENFPEKALFVSRWPLKSPYAVVLTHDVDRTRFFSLTNFIRNIIRKTHDYNFKRAVYFLLHPKDDPYYCLEKLKDYEQNIGVKSTFFFLTVKRDEHGRRYNLKKMSGFLEELRKDGWEIALHASLQSKRKPEKLKTERKIIERASGNQIKGIRYHYLIEDENILYTADLEGFSYDSSVAHPRKWELIRPSCSYYYPWHTGFSRYLKIREFPITLTDMAILAGEKYSEEHVNSIKSQGGILNLLWHQRMFSQMFNGIFSRIYERVIEESKREGAWIGTLSDLDEYLFSRQHLTAIEEKNALRAGSDLKEAVLFSKTIDFTPVIRGRGDIGRIGRREFKINLFAGDEVAFD